MIDSCKIFPNVEFREKLRIFLKNFGLIEKLIVAVGLKENKEHFFEFNDVEVIFDMLKVEVKSFKRKFFKLFANFVIIRFLFW